MGNVYLKKIISAALIILITVQLCACGKVYDIEKSPRIISVEVRGENDGTEEGQYLIVKLTFDKVVSVGKKTG